ncbi:MAG: hypothetical protein ACYSTG_05485, partial [Planctomycetota bacterium]
MPRRFISIKPIDQTGETPDRPSDEVLWERLQNVWFDVGLLKKRPGLDAAAHTALAATAVDSSPAHVVVEYRHPINTEADNTERPNGAGANTNWTAVGGLDNYLSVNTAQTIVSTYVYSDTSLEKDSYAFSNTSLVALDKLIFSVHARRDKFVDYDITIFARTGGGVELDVGTVTIEKSTTGALVWKTYTVEADTDPHTSAAWTPANVNAYEFGYYATFSTEATTEYLAPTGDGVNVAWDKTGASYNAVFAANGPNTGGTGAGNIWSGYVSTNVDDEKAGVTFSNPVASFSTITAIEPIVYRSTLYGRRQLVLSVTDGADDNQYVKKGYNPTDAPRIRYENYITQTFDPNLVEWNAGSIDYATDPITAVAWDPSTAFTYEWVLNTTDAHKDFEFQVHSAPDAITGTDWELVDRVTEASGSVACTDGSGTVYSDSAAFDSNTQQYRLYAYSSITGNFSGEITTDNLTHTVSSQLIRPWFSGYMYWYMYSSTFEGPYTGTLTQQFNVNETFTVGDNSQVLELSTDSTLTVSGPLSLSTGRLVGIVFANKSVTLRPEINNGFEYFGGTLDASLFNRDFWYDNVSNGSYPQLSRGSGTFPLNVSFEDLPTLNYRLIRRLIAGVYGFFDIPLTG